MSPEPEADRPTLSVILPAYNEAGTSAACLAASPPRSPGSTSRSSSSTTAPPTRPSPSPGDGPRRTPSRADPRPREEPGDRRRPSGPGSRRPGANMSSHARPISGSSPDDWAPFADALGSADVLVGCRERREGYNPLMRFNSWLYPQLVASMFGLRLRDVNWICVYRRDLVARVDDHPARHPDARRDPRQAPRPRGELRRGRLPDAGPDGRQALGRAAEGHVAHA